MNTMTNRALRDQMAHMLREREASAERNHYNDGGSDMLRTVIELVDAADTYNGYANRETWAFNLHWQNDHGLYLATLDAAEGYLSATYGPGWKSLPADEAQAAIYGVGEFVVQYWTDYISDQDYAPENGTPLRMFEREVGSWWRIDYREVGEAVRESLDAEGVGEEVDES